MGMPEIMSCRILMWSLGALLLVSIMDIQTILNQPPYEHSERNHVGRFRLFVSQACVSEGMSHRHPHRFKKPCDELAKPLLVQILDYCC